MRFHLENGVYLGTVEWRGPQHVELEIADPHMREWFRSYFSGEDPGLTGTVDCPTFAGERRDASAAAFARALAELGAMAYSVRPAFPENALREALR